MSLVRPKEERKIHALCAWLVRLVLGRRSLYFSGIVIVWFVVFYNPPHDTTTFSGIHNHGDADALSLLLSSVAGNSHVRLIKGGGDEAIMASQEWPPLETLVAPNGTIIGNVQHALDFVIAGHPKTGTTSLMRWLHKHPQVRIMSREVQTDMKHAKPNLLLAQLYHLYPYNATLEATRRAKRGYKAPNEIYFYTGLRTFGRYWPQTKIIVGVRHPVSMFQSWYNFRVSQKVKMPPPEDFSSIEVLPLTFRFHENLAKLWKTPRQTLAELELLQTFPKIQIMDPQHEEEVLLQLGLDPHESSPSPIPNPVFLYETRQVDSSTDAAQFRADLSAFLNIRQIPSQSKENVGYNRQFQICQPQFQPLRDRLLLLGADMRDWILTYFVQSPDVTISSPEQFESLVRMWGIDPCETNTTNQTASKS